MCHEIRVCDLGQSPFDSNGMIKLPVNTNNLDLKKFGLTLIEGKSQTE